MLLRRQVSIDTAFSVAMELEDEAGGLYRRFAQLYETRPEIARFWRELSEDEDRHYLALHTSRSRLQSMGVSEVFVDVDLGRLQDLVLVIRRAAARAVDRDYSVREAVGVAWMLEISEAERLLDLLTRLPQDLMSEETSTFMGRLLNGTDDHALRLRRFAQEHGVALP